MPSVRSAASWKKKNYRLRGLLAEHGIADGLMPTQRSADPASIRPKLSTSEKIALFRSLFRGREDVYAQRWEGPDGRSGYSPRTERDWNAYNAATPEDRKRVDKATRRKIPLTDEAIHAHLAGSKRLACIHSCWTKPVGSSRLTLTKRRGGRMHRRSFQLVAS